MGRARRASDRTALVLRGPGRPARARRTAARTDPAHPALMLVELAHRVRAHRALDRIRRARRASDRMALGLRDRDRPARARRTAARTDPAHPALMLSVLAHRVRAHRAPHRMRRVRRASIRIVSVHRRLGLSPRARRKTVQTGLAHRASVRMVPALPVLAQPAPDLIRRGRSVSAPMARALLRRVHLATVHRAMSPRARPAVAAPMVSSIRPSSVVARRAGFVPIARSSRRFRIPRAPTLRAARNRIALPSCSRAPGLPRGARSNG